MFYISAQPFSCGQNIVPDGAVRPRQGRGDSKHFVRHVLHSEFVVTPDEVSQGFLVIDRGQFPLIRPHPRESETVAVPLGALQRLVVVVWLGTGNRIDERDRQVSGKEFDRKIDVVERNELNPRVDYLTYCQ